jgi:hypothetical protein
MWPYWLLFLIPALAAFQQPTRPWVLRPAQRVHDMRGDWLLVTIGVALMVGLRHQVGGDWGTYLEHSLATAEFSFEEAVFRADPGYWLIIWLTADLSWGIHAANLIFGCIFSIGLVVFCREQPRPWLALAVAVPYLVIVLGMGYTRQGVALGLAMLGLVALNRRSTLVFVGWVAAGALFHRSAVILIPLGILATPRNRVWTFVWVSVVAVALYDALLSESVDALSLNYIEAEYQSEGALVRVMMNVLPALFALCHRKRLTSDMSERNLWTWISLLALASAAWLLISPSSTAVDRVALYLIPLQLYVFTRLPDLMTGESGGRRLWVATVLAYYAIVQFVWLVFATHSEYWIPYRFFPLEG